MSKNDPLALFLPPVQKWFRQSLGEPTPVQREGWPAIAAGNNTLLLAPTGSGKTLAAFLACLDRLWRQPDLEPGVQVLYISPLKALNNDIYRNLQAPLEGVAEAGQGGHPPLPIITSAVRTGDTPPAERARLLRKPPHVLITTPESLHILLTSKAREGLRGVRQCIIDEIHALCGNKRGVFLALLLERLEALCPRGFTRIGLSATQRPLEEVGRFLGGCRLAPSGQLEPRPVTIIDAGLRKNLDLKVISPVDRFGPLEEKTIWPSIYRRLAQEIRQHQSTIVFANNRRAVERITAAVNEVLATQTQDAGEEPILVRAHHGSVSLEVRRQTELALKEGRLKAVVATASLELGIDMGAVDLVCQVESTGNVARGLQRVGRAGHLVGQQSKGRLIPKTTADLLDQAVLASEMAAGRVEALRVPTNCLDVLAQQIVAMVAMDTWAVDDLFDLVRRAYPFRDLSPLALDSVLEMVSGRFRLDPPVEDLAGTRPVKPTQQLTALAPRLSWDRVHHRLHALPGSQRLAILNGGTIPDTGQYAVLTMDGLRVGEADEEFVYERRVGDAFLLGTTSWRIRKIEADRVLVAPAEGAPGMAPFWRGESTGRTYELGQAQGGFLGQLVQRLDDRDCLDWLQRDYFLDLPSARNLRDYVRRQWLRTGGVPTHQHYRLEACRDPLGDWQVLLLGPLGSRFHLGLRLALENLLRRRLGYRPQCLHHDDGILIRLTESEEPVLDLFTGLAAARVRGMILEELADSPLFALRFRHNAARALLMPRGGGNRRAPLWLQRLRGRDLLQVARRHPDFPIVAETFRECLHDHLDLPRLIAWLEDLEAGRIHVKATRLETPSPFAATMLFSFTMANMYVYDVVDGEPDRTAANLNPDLLDQLIGQTEGGLPLDARAIMQVERRLRGLGHPPRSAAEMAEWLRRLGDIAPAELEGPMSDWLAELTGQGRATRITLPGVAHPERWVLQEEATLYQDAFVNEAVDPERQRQAATTILQRFLNTHALVGMDDLLRRYPLEAAWVGRQLQAWADTGRAVAVSSPQAPEALAWSAPANHAQLQRGTLSFLRNEIVPCPAAQFADFLLVWQGVHPTARKSGQEGLETTLSQLQNYRLSSEIIEFPVLANRIADYQPRWLDDLTARGQWLWRGHPRQGQGPEAVALLARANLDQLGPPPYADGLDPGVLALQTLLQQQGASFVPDLARVSGLPPSVVRAGLWELARRGLATNDQFEVVRKGEEDPVGQTGSNSRPTSRTLMKQGRRPRAPEKAEGRWSLIPWARPDVEMQTVFLAHMLLQRYGIVAREVAAQEKAAPPWRILYEVLSRLEWSGKVRRGYFVEALSGAQFGLPEAVQGLQDRVLAVTAQEPVVLLHSLDPANLYGSGAPLPLSRQGGEPRPFSRRLGNWLVMHAGKPILLIEQQGKRLQALAGVDPGLLTQAVATLPRLLQHGLSRKITVESWNDEPATSSPGRALLEEAGFVRDYQALTFYGTAR